MARSRPRGRQPTPELAAWAARVIPGVVAYARTLLRHSADAEDVVHDVLCRLLKHEEYDLIADGEKLLFRSVTNACINRRTRARRLFSLDTSGEDDDPPLIATLGSDRALDPARIAMTAELRQMIQRGLAVLPPMQRAALELKSIGHTLNSVAEILDVTSSNAGVLIHRARKALAAHLKPILQEGNET